MSNQKVAIGSNSSKSSRIAKHKLVRRLAIVAAVLVLATIGYLAVSKLIDESNMENVLTIKDLEDPNLELASNTSDASVENLTKELKAKIDKQISDKENPVDTVMLLAGILSNTTNQKRQNQLTDFIENFLKDHSDSLWFGNDSNKPDQAKVNYWKSQLYSYLVNNFRLIMDNEFKDSKGKLVDNTNEQIKYIDLYVKLALDPKSHKVIPEEQKEFMEDYKYDSLDDFMNYRDEIIRRNKR